MITADIWEIRFQAAARRAISRRLPEAVAAVVIEFCDSALADNRIAWESHCSAGWAAAMERAVALTRNVYRIDEEAHTVRVLDIVHRTDVYHGYHG